MSVVATRPAARGRPVSPRVPVTWPDTHERKTVVLASLNIGKIWKSLIPGLCGTATHSCVMFLKYWTGFLPSFHPYEDLQRTLGNLVGSSVHPVVPWALSFLNSIVVLGFLFSLIYRLLPGRYGVVKGFVFGVFGWIVLGLIFYPALGLGLFATHVGLGVLPGLFSLLMVLSYSIVVGIAYSALSSKGVAGSN